MMVNNGINSYEQLEIKLDVSQDTIFNMINNMIEKKVFDWDDIDLKFLYFIFLNVLLWLLDILIIRKILRILCLKKLMNVLNIYLKEKI